MKSENTWRKQLKIDAVPVLLASQNKALIYFTKRDLLDESSTPIDYVWELPEPQKLLKQARADGRREKKAAGKPVYPPYHYKLVDVFKTFRVLVERYAFTKEHPVIPILADFLFSCQTGEGDIRGFIGNQYATYYTGYVLSLLIKAGYENDSRMEKGMRWLLSMRQDDGGWTIPILTHKFDRDTMNKLTSQFIEPVAPERTQPFSHNWTDMVLRAFAAHPQYRKSKEASAAGALLKARFFQHDNYSSYHSAKYWTRFAFWWPNLLTALNTLYFLGFTKDDPDIRKGLNWFLENQSPDGLWKLESIKVIKTRDLEDRLWLALAVCRLLKRYLP
jgi:hypothetical protein